MAHAVSRSYSCTWCGMLTNPEQLSCSSCGATVDVKEVVTHSGWTQLPPRPDMAKLQFGNSYCQIEGAMVPVADFNLAGDASVYFGHHVLLWKDTTVDVHVMPMKGIWNRLLSGMPLIMTEARGTGHIAFSRDAPGELIALPLQPGQSIDVREHLFMVATGEISYDWFDPNVWFDTYDGSDTETYYPVGVLMDRFKATDRPGLLLLHAAGNVFVRTLEEGQSILVKPSAFIFKDVEVDMQLHFEHPEATYSSWKSWSNRYLWLRLSGPGRVAVSSVFEYIEGESEQPRRSSPATERRW